MSMKPSVTIGLPNAAIIPTGVARPVAATLPQAVECIVAAAQPIRIVLFGSYAYGRPTPDSDVDLLIVMETTASRVERYALISQALWPHQFPVDILVKTPAEVEQALAAGDPFLEAILRRGRVLYERPG